jgi:transaldolase / glucose-6-phosphate isomerase
MEYPGFKANLADFEQAVENALTKMKAENTVSRIWEHDHTVWKDVPAEITNRLGWLKSPEEMTGSLSEIGTFVDEIRSFGYTHALLLGMGGSSMAPEVFRFTFGVKEGYPDLQVLDSTDPGAVLARERGLDPEKALFIVSTKSGGTIETLSFLKYFYNRTVDKVGREKAGEHFAAITDPGSGLESLAKELNFRKIFLNDPEIGGRYSALSYFGLVPAALVGVDLNLFLERARSMAKDACSPIGPAEESNSSARLGAVIGELAKLGRDKLTFILSPSLKYFGAWLEQLIAESTGKEGKGILPVDGEDVLAPEHYAKDRLFISICLKGDEAYDAKVKALGDAGHPTIQIDLNDLYDLGGEFFRWEMATVVSGVCLGINPFDQPDVESAKIRAREMVLAYQKEGELPQMTPSLKEDSIEVYFDSDEKSLKEMLKRFFEHASSGEGESKGRSYAALQAYLTPDTETTLALQNLRRIIQTQYRIATTIGYGPRFLHSTGQLHKGDAGNGLFIQFTADIAEDAPIPDDAGKEDSSISFGVLKTAQALGDCQALKDAGRDIIRFHFQKDPISGLKRLKDILL